MNKLTPKQNAFARLVATGTVSLSDAYREVCAADRMSPAAVRAEASRVMAHPDVSLMVRRLRARVEQDFTAATLSDRDHVLTCEGKGHFHKDEDLCFSLYGNSQRRRTCYIITT